MGQFSNFGRIRGYLSFYLECSWYESCLFKERELHSSITSTYLCRVLNNLRTFLDNLTIWCEFPITRNTKLLFGISSKQWTFWSEGHPSICPKKISQIDPLLKKDVSLLITEMWCKRVSSAAITYQQTVHFQEDLPGRNDLLLGTVTKDFTSLNHFQ